MTTATMACGDRKAAQWQHATPPRVVSLGSTILQQSDSEYVGRPGGFAVTATGSYLVSDKISRTVRVYSSDGRYIRSIGLDPKGNGTLERAGAIAVAGDSLALVSSGPDLYAFDLMTGMLRWTRTMPALPNTIIAGDSRIFFNHLNYPARRSIVAIRGARDSAEAGGPFPSPLGRDTVLDQFYSFMRIDDFANDTLAVGMLGSNYLFIAPFATRALDSVWIPPVRRHGARLDLIAQVRKHPETAPTALYSASVPWAITRFSSGLFAYVAADEQLYHKRILARLYVSLVDPRLKRTCADAIIPAPIDPAPLVAFRGDTLLVLAQDLDRQGNAQTAVVRFSVVPDGCTWLSQP